MHPKWPLESPQTTKHVGQPGAGTLEGMTQRLSIIIPTRNRETYLVHLLQVIRDVRSEVVEFVVVDNSDEPIPKTLLPNDQRLRIVRSPSRLSMTSNWELGLVSAEAPWRTFIGDDDGIIPSEVDKLIQRLESSTAEAVVAGFAHFYWPSDQNSNGVISVWKSRGISSSQLGLTGNAYRDFNNIYFPIPYARTVFNVSLESKVRSIQGGMFFTASAPDINSGATISMHADSIDYIPEIVPFIVGTSPASNGLSNPSGDTKKDFFQLSDHKWLEDLGPESKELSFLSYIEPIAQSRKASHQPLELPARTVLIWKTLLSTPRTMEIVDHLQSVFPGHSFTIKALSLGTSLAYPIVTLVEKLGWAASRMLISGDRYYRKKSHGLRTTPDASKALDTILNP